MSLLPHISEGQAFSGLIVKPVDRYDVFHPESNLDATEQIQGFCGRNYKFFPTQVCVSIIATDGLQRVVDVLIEGLDQFGFRASETIRITVNANQVARVGSKRCYAAFFTFRKIRQVNVQAGDQYSVGIGRSSSDFGSPPAMPTGSFRIPLLARLRSANGFRGVQSIEDGVFLHNETGFVLDLSSQAIELQLPDGNARFFVQALDARVAALSITNR